MGVKQGKERAIDRAHRQRMSRVEAITLEGDLSHYVRARMAAAGEYAGRMYRRLTNQQWAEPEIILGHATAALLAAEEAQFQAVVAARRSGASWATIGEFAGISKQGAMQKWARRVDQAIAAVAIDASAENSRRWEPITAMEQRTNAWQEAKIAEEYALEG